MFFYDFEIRDLCKSCKMLVFVEGIKYLSDGGLQALVTSNQNFRRLVIACSDAEFYD